MGKTQKQRNGPLPGAEACGRSWLGAEGQPAGCWCFMGADLVSRVQALPVASQLMYFFLFL